MGRRRLKIQGGAVIQSEVLTTEPGMGMLISVGNLYAITAVIA